ncbi:hypothetical protein A1O1_05133 [Capronia coronata CBS 617.96]|uniref:RTA1 domain protein n=1 Tax=Capronia coronata CBS 617.96 TaxID=1182541 RepID=W9Y6N9_9EURO|nr:uncharacterized protein A1O1_05133 [Capronia coronata CBS 617.96]EXJ88203.1 hypothetical protein A1O1_05133 [Capronia coronata CBS 617.96]
MATDISLYPYNPSHVLPIIFATLVGLSLLLYVFQNLYWRVMYFMCWGGAVFTTGWILRAVSTYHPTHLGLYVGQAVCIYGGPPIYSAAEYNILGRLLHYLPMHAPLNPNRVLYFFLYLGVLVEALTAAGAARIAAARGDLAVYKSGGTLISIGLVLQAVLECLFMAIVAWLHRRCRRSGMLAPNVRSLCIMLYGTSTLILLRCIYRAVEAFATFNSLTSCSHLCRALLLHDWYIYAFEAAPMVMYTYWLNIIHPGRLLPAQSNRYLDLDGKTERRGPGWTEKRATWWTFLDPFDLRGRARGQPQHEEFWLHPQSWPVCEDGSYAQRTGTKSRVAWPC